MQSILTLWICCENNFKLQVNFFDTNVSQSPHKDLIDIREEHYIHPPCPCFNEARLQCIEWAPDRWCERAPSAAVWVWVLKEQQLVLTSWGKWKTGPQRQLHDGCPLQSHNRLTSIQTQDMPNIKKERLYRTVWVCPGTRVDGNQKDNYSCMVKVMHPKDRFRFYIYKCFFVKNVFDYCLL